MQLIIFTIVFYIILGGVGMYFGNRKVDAFTAKQRWQKYIAYLLITSIVVVSIWFQFFSVFALLIALVGYYELIRTINKKAQPWIALIFYSVIVAGFMIYAFKFTKEFQFFLYFQILAFDAFSQVTGQLIGRRLIAPGISPSKTLEGLLGGVFFCILSSVLTKNLLHISTVAAVGFGLFTSITGFTGDLLASYYKRIAGIKDYSNLLPGQGGFLDRFDSFMMAAFGYSIVYTIGIRITGVL